MKEAELDIQKNNLIEQLGVFMESKHQLAPVAARILSTLVLTGQLGITFDQLVENLSASKSTVSTHLDHLQATGKIKYFTKSGDRKRYFIINPDLMMNVIDEMVTKWEVEKTIHQNILDYKEKRNELNKEKEIPLFDLDFQKNILIFLKEATAAIQKLKQNIINKKNVTNNNS